MTVHHALVRRRRGRSAVAATGVLALVAGAVTLAGSAAGAADLPDSFLSTSSVWKISDNNTDPSAGTDPYDRLAWTKAGYDDSAWRSAAGSFGSKNGVIGSVDTAVGSLTPATLLHQFIDGVGYPDIPTIHFRTSFDLSADQLGDIAGLTGEAVFDDVVQIFVNGTKVSGAWGDDAVNAAPATQQNLIYTRVGVPVGHATFEVPKNLLVAGTNTVAVALYNDRETSSDLYFDLKSLVPDLVTPGTPYGEILQVGADASQRIVTWYTDADSEQVLQLAPSSQVTGDEFPAGATTFSAFGAANTTTTGYNRHTTITGLAEDTEYSYRVGAEGAWSPVHTFKTQTFDGDYDFLFFGDPQIGSSGDEVLDGAGWADTLDVALSANPDTELLVSGGDEVETANVESQWTQFLAPEELKQYPWVSTIGNHDVGGKAWEQHHDLPNYSQAANLYANGDPNGAQSGGDYWFIYKDVLFIDINSNAGGTTAKDQAHVDYVNDVVAQHGAEAKYSVVVFHHPPYSPGTHSNDSDIAVRRVDFPTAFSQAGIDLVLNGHDHSYARSYEIKNGAKANPDEQPGAADVYVGEGGVIWVTANSASGSKYYDIAAPVGTETSGAGRGPDPLDPSKHWYSSVENQEHVRSYVKVQVRSDKLVVENIRSGTCDAPNAAVQRSNVSWCGPDSGASPAQPVGSLVDSVTIHPYYGDGSQELQVKVPTGAPGEFGWAIDGYNGLVDLGTAEDKGDYLEASGSLNPITVTDTRSSQTPWSISGSVSDFRDGETTFSGKYLGWTPQVLVEGAGATAGAPVESGYDAGDGLSVSRGLASATAGHDTGEGKVGADVDLKIPADVDPGSYRATLTITALSS